jgi:hypothetical protein
MAFQGVFTPRGEINQLLEVEGSKIIGTKIKAPFAISPEVYVLPMDNVLSNKVRLEVEIFSNPPTLSSGNWCCDVCTIRLTG